MVPITIPSFTSSNANCGVITIQSVTLDSSIATFVPPDQIQIYTIDITKVG